MLLNWNRRKLEGSMATVPCFEEIQLEQICRVLGETASGSEISAMFQQIDIPDENPMATKWVGYMQLSVIGNDGTGVGIASCLSFIRQ
jgi:hypothetical protein